MKDKYGSKVEVGVKVAFNWCGEVRIGNIVKIEKSVRYGRTEDYGGRPYFNYHIKHQDKDIVTIVKDIKSLSVI